MNINTKIFLFTAAINGITYSITPTLYPNLSYSKGFTESFVGIIFSLFSFGNIFFIPFTNNLILYFSRFSLLIIAVSLNLVSIFLYSILFYIDSYIYYIIFSITTRILQGLAVEYTMILLFSLSIITSDHESEESIGNIELLMSIGRVIGPIISYLIGWKRYIYIYLLIFLLLVIVLYLLLFKLTLSKAKINQLSDEEEISFIKHVKFTFKDHIHEKTMIKEEETIYDNNINSLNTIDQYQRNRKFSDFTFNFDEVMKKRIEIIRLKQEKIALNDYINKKESHNEKYLYGEYSQLYYNGRFSVDNNEDNKNIQSHNTSFYSIKVPNYHNKQEYQINNSHNEHNQINNGKESDIYYQSKQQPKITVYFFLSNILHPLIFSTFLISIFDFTCQIFYTPVFTLHMKNKFGLSNETSSLLLSLFFIAYAFGMKIVITISQILPTKLMLSIGLLINSLSLVFYSPSGIFSQSLALSLFGFFLQSFFGGIICLNAIVDITESLKRIGYNDFISADYSCALYLLAVNISELIAPLIGGILTERFDFSFACFWVGVFNFIFSFFIFIFDYNRIYKEISQL